MEGIPDTYTSESYFGKPEGAVEALNWCVCVGGRCVGDGGRNRS